MPSCKQRPERGRQQAERGDHHGRQRHRHARHRALHGDPPGAAGDLHRVREAVEPVGGEHHVGRLGGGGRAARAHRHPDRGRGQRGGVVEAVTDHHGHRALPLGAHAGDLARRCLLGAHLVEPEDLPDLPGRFGPVPGEHHQPLDTGGAQPPQGAARVDPQRVLQQDGADRLGRRRRPTPMRSRPGRPG